MAALELEGWPADQALTISGGPRSLRLPITVSNRSARPIVLPNASLTEVTREAGGASLNAELLPIGLVAPANGTVSGAVRLRLDRTTPPGRYSGQIRFGDLIRPIAVEVVAHTEAAVLPDPLVVDAASGLTQRLDVVVENRGNTRLLIDLAGRYPFGREQPLGSQQAREIADRGLDRLLEVVRDLEPRPSLVEVGHAGLSMPDGAVTLEPGEAANLTLELSLPGPLDPTARYHLFAPVYTADLHTVIITSTKSVSPRGSGDEGEDNPP